MTKNKLVITVSGKEKTGKSRLSLLLKNFLNENGFDVELEDTQSNIDMSKGFDHVIDNIKKTSKLVLVEKIEKQK